MHRNASEEIGLYKDTFLLDDRVLLFLHDLRERMHEDSFRAWTQKLMMVSDLTPESRPDSLDPRGFSAIESHRLWLEASAICVMNRQSLGSKLNLSRRV